MLQWPNEGTTEAQSASARAARKIRLMRARGGLERLVAANSKVGQAKGKRYARWGMGSDEEKRKEKETSAGCASCTCESAFINWDACVGLQTM